MHTIGVCSFWLVLEKNVHFNGQEYEGQRNWLVALSILRLLVKITKGQSNWCIPLHAMLPLVNVVQNI